MSASHPNYDLLPEHIREGVRMYVEQGIPPGHFVTAVICGDLFEAFDRADDVNTHRMLDLVRFFYNETPSQCWGSREKMDAWMERQQAWVRASRG